MQNAYIYTFCISQVCICADKVHILEKKTRERTLDLWHMRPEFYLKTKPPRQNVKPKLWVLNYRPWAWHYLTLHDWAKSCAFLKSPCHEDSEKVYHVYGGQKFARLAVREVCMDDMVLGVYSPCTANCNRNHKESDNRSQPFHCCNYVVQTQDFCGLRLSLVCNNMH